MLVDAAIVILEHTIYNGQIGHLVHEAVSVSIFSIHSCEWLVLQNGQEILIDERQA